MNALHALWQQRSVRERRLLVLAAALLALALLWFWALAPALQTWRSAPQRQAELDQQSRQMLQWQAQARQLQNPARLARALKRPRAQVSRPVVRHGVWRWVELFHHASVAREGLTSKVMGQIVSTV